MISHLLPFGQKVKMNSERPDTASKSVCMDLAAVVLKVEMCYLSYLAAFPYRRHLNEFQHRPVCAKASWLASSTAHGACKCCIFTVADLLWIIIYNTADLFKA